MAVVVLDLPSSLSQEEAGHIHAQIFLLCPSSSSCCYCCLVACLPCLVLVDHTENFHRRHLLCPTLLHHHNRDLVPSLDLVLDLVGHTLLVHHLDHRRPRYRDHSLLALVASSAAAVLRHRYRVHRDS